MSSSNLATNHPANHPDIKKSRCSQNPNSCQESRRMYQYCNSVCQQKDMSYFPRYSNIFCLLFCICLTCTVSNVTGENIDLVRTFLNMIPQHGVYDSTASFEFRINDTFSVPFVGTVVSGIVKSGVVHVGDTVLVGPDSLGQFATTTIRSIERKRISVPVASAGQSASFALKKVKRKDVRKGMVVLPKLENVVPIVCREFVAEGKSYFCSYLLFIYYIEY